MKAVLDASALLAYLQNELGSEAVEAMLTESIISSVSVDGMRDDLEAVGLIVSPFTPEEAEIAGRLWQQTRQYGLSLGDRTCLSLGLRLGVPVLTTDQAWASLNLPITVHVVR